MSPVPGVSVEALPDGSHQASIATPSEGWGGIEGPPLFCRLATVTAPASGLQVVGPAAG